jgi:hypothetical protein
MVHDRVGITLYAETDVSIDFFNLGFPKVCALNSQVFGYHNQANAFIAFASFAIVRRVYSGSEDDFDAFLLLGKDACRGQEKQTADEKGVVEEGFQYVIHGVWFEDKKDKLSPV